MGRRSEKTPNKSDFIRRLPPSLSASEVVAKGKAAGVTFSTQLVYNVRRGSKATREKARRSTMAKPSTTTATKTQSKAAFIRSLPATMSAKDVVAKAKAAGITIADTYVYWARGSSKRKVRTKRATPSRKGASVRRPISNISSAETLLRAVAAEIGLGRAMEILAGERAMIRA